MNELPEYQHLLHCCREREQEERRRGFETGTIVMARFARIMEHDFFPRFQQLAWEHSQRLKTAVSVTEFDDHHHHFVEELRQGIKAHNGTVVPYGEAQQPVNIFLKEYIEKSGILPEADSLRLIPFLHVTLDGVIILYLRALFQQDYMRHITDGEQPLPSVPFEREEISPSSLRQLLSFGREEYQAWQEWFRHISPVRPVLLDSIWSISRQTLLGQV